MYINNIKLVIQYAVLVLNILYVRETAVYLYRGYVLYTPRLQKYIIYCVHRLCIGDVGDSLAYTYICRVSVVRYMQPSTKLWSRGFSCLTLHSYLYIMKKVASLRVRYNTL